MSISTANLLEDVAYHKSSNGDDKSKAIWNEEQLHGKINSQGDV
jgi:hypothetical protein